MKKFLALLLAVLMVIPATLVPASAAEQTETGVKLNNCCDILATDFTTQAAFFDNAGFTVGMFEGKQAVSFTSLFGNNSAGTQFKLAYRRSTDDASKFSAGEDISGMTHLVFDLYLSDVSGILDRQQVYVELGSDNRPDHNEVMTKGTALEFLSGKSLVAGWNHIEIPISAFAHSSGNDGVFDPTNWNYFRFYNVSAFPGGVTMALANMYFTNYDCEEHYSHAKYQFSVRDKQAGYDAQNKYLEKAGSPSGDGVYYFNDATNSTIYRYDGIDGDRVARVTLNAQLGAQIVVWVSKSVNGPWVPVYTFKSNSMEQFTAVGLTASQNICLWKDADGTHAWFKGSETARDQALSADTVAGVTYLTSKTAAGTIEGFDAATATYAGIKINPASADQLSVASYTLDLTSAFNSLPGDSNQLFVKIGDSYPADGWGGSIRGVVTLDVCYDESIPEFVENTVEYSFDVLRASEGAYLFEDTANVAQNGSKNNYARYGDKTAYFTYRFPLGNAKNADALYFTATTQGQLNLKVSTDNRTWVDAYKDSTILSAGTRSYDLLAALKSANNTATSADYLYVRVCDAETGNGNGGGLAAYTTATLYAKVNDSVDVRAYEDNSFLLFTQGEQSHIVYDSSSGQAGANGSYDARLNDSGQLNTQTIKLNNVDTLATRQMTHAGKVTAANNVDMAASWMMDESPNGNANNVNKYTFKYNDGTRSIQYEYQVSPDHLRVADRLTYHAYMGNQILIQLSVDGGATWPYTLLNDMSTNADRSIKIDLLSIDGLRDALIEAGGSFQIKISDPQTSDGWGAKIVGYDEVIVPTDTGKKESITVGGVTKEVTVCNYNSYPRKPYAVSMTMEYDANTAGKVATIVTNEYNYVGEPIYTKVDNDASTPYRMAMPSDPNEPLYTGLDTAGTKIQTGRMSDGVKKASNTVTQAGGVYDGNWNGRFNDNNYFVYYYSIADLDTTRNLTLSLPLGGQFGIKVAVGSSVCPRIVTTHNDVTNGNSWGGDDWNPVSNYLSEGGSGNGPNSAMRTYTIDPATFGDAINTATHIYFMFYDFNAYDKLDGYGARVPLGKMENGVPTQPITFSYHSLADVKGIAGASLSLTEDFNVTYSVGNVSADAAPIFTFSLGNDASKLVVSAPNAQGRLVAPFENIMPYRLAETITTKMYAKVDGVVHTFDHTYSVKDYCERMLPKSTSAEMTALLNAILAYGDTAQDYVGYKVDAKPSMGVEGFVAPTTTYTLGTYTNHRALTGTATTATWKSATLLLGSETMIALTFEAADVNGLSVLVDGKTVGYKALGNNLYRVDIPVMPNAFDQPIKASFAGNDGYVLSYSVGSYFETRYESTGDATRAMLDALYNYGVAASAFAAN